MTWWERKTVNHAGEKVILQCAHGDIVTYPVGSVELEVQGRVLTVEAAVSNQLPSSVLFIRVAAVEEG